MPNRERIPAQQAANLSTGFSGFMKPVNLITLVNVELIIDLSRRNSGTYRCCTWNLSPPLL